MKEANIQGDVLLGEANRFQRALLQPASPNQNAFVASFSGKLCEHCLDLNRIASIYDVISPTGASPTRYNHAWRHRKTGNIHLLNSQRMLADLFDLPHRPVFECRRAA